VLATDSRESTVALLAAANCSGVVNMVESPELIVNADVGQAIAGSRIFFAALQHSLDYRTDSPNVNYFCALQQFGF
jgi:hypothetical protein